ncbi:MAG: M13 family metallopeptidase N-terminal domain-containing protein [Chitinophagaceae bacterium]
MNTTISYLVKCSIAAVVLVSCKENKEAKRTQFIETKNIDKSVNPGDDFYDYANGAWLKTAKIPDEYSSTGAGLDVYLSIQKRLKELLENASKNTGETGSIQQKVGDFYASGMDSVTINKLGYEPVKPLLSKIDAANSVPALMQIAANETKNTYNPNMYNTTPNLFGFMVYADQKNSTMNIAWLTQGGIGLPERDYYFRTDAATVGVQNAYKNYLTTLFKLTGSDAATAAKNTATVYNIEKELASSHKTVVQLRDMQANYHKVSMEKIEKEQPNIGWKAFFKNLGAKADSVDMEQPEYYAKLNTMLKTVPISDWKLYLKAHALTAYANLLSQDFQNAAFDYSKMLNGQKKQRQRWERIAGKADAGLGDALGQLYVEKYFPPEAKKKIDELINNTKKMNKEYTIKIFEQKQADTEQLFRLMQSVPCAKPFQRNPKKKDIHLNILL